MSAQLVNSRAHQGIPSGIFAGNFRAALCSSMQSLCRVRVLPAPSLRLTRPGARLSTCRQVQWVPSNEFYAGATSQLGLRWVIPPFDEITRRTRRCRRWNRCSRDGCGVHRRKTGIKAISNLEATGMCQSSNTSGNQESDMVILDLQGLKSGSCVARVRRVLVTDTRVLSVAVSLTTQTAAIRLKPSSSLGAGDSLNVAGELASRLTGAGFNSKPRPTGKTESTFRRKLEEIARKRAELLKNSSGQVAFAWALGAFCFATHATHVLYSFGIHGFMGDTISSFPENPTFKACISSVALLGPGRDLLMDGLKALWRRSPNVNSLVGVGAGAFCAISAVSLVFPRLHWDASFLDIPVMLLACVLFGRAMDGHARAEASRGTHDLLAALPSRSRLVVSETGTGELTEDEAGLTQELVVGVDSEQLRPGDYVLVLPGEVIPVDGKVMIGKSVVDESMLVGKPLSVHKTSGNIVSAGTVNREGPLTVEATATGAQSAVSEIVKHVEEVQHRNSTVQRLSDVLPGSTAFSIMGLSGATFFFWYFVGAYVFPDVLYKEVAASGGSAFLPSLKLATDVIVVGCFCTLGLATPTAVLLGKSVGPKTTPLTRREDLQKRSVGVDSVLPYKDGDTVAGSPTEDTPTAEAAGANFEDIGAQKNDAGLIIDDRKGEQPRASCKDAVAWQGDARSLTDNGRAGQPGASCEDFVAGKDDIGLSLDDSRAERPAASGEDIVVGKDDAGLLAENSKAEQLDVSGEVIIATKNEARPPTYDDKVDESGASGVYLVAAKDTTGPPRDDVKAEEPGSDGEGLVAEEDDARSLTVESKGDELSAYEQDFNAKKDISELPTGESNVEEHSASGKESIKETDGRGSPTVRFEAEEHGASEQEVVPEKDDAGSLTVESKAEEHSISEQKLAAKKGDGALSVVEPKGEEQSSIEQEFVTRKDHARSLTVEAEAEEHSASEQDLVAREDDEGSANVEYKVDEHTSSDQGLVAEKGDAGSPTGESKAEEHRVREQELAAKNGDEASPIAQTEVEAYKQSDKGAEDKRHGGDEGERPIKKVQRKRETTVSKSGRKRLSKEESEAGTKTKKKKKKKDPTAPKRALPAFMCFSQAVREDLKKSRPELSFSDTGRVLGEMWKEMSADEKAPFEAIAKADKERYTREMQKWCERGKDDLPKD